MGPIRGAGQAWRLRAGENVAAPGIDRAGRGAGVISLHDRRAEAAFDAIAGDDPQIRAAKERAARFARSDLPVLLLAETGTGKDLFARAIHEAGRSGRPFIAINCGTLPAELLESELFGYAPGAFTGARARGQEGKLAAADGGTLFLDEVAEMPPALQALLLRVLEDGSYSRIGEVQQRSTRFRLVCATCRDLPALVEAGAFRRDLFHRINGAILELPPLRARTDLPALVTALLAAAAREQGTPAPTVAPAALEALCAHDWPGNVRELKMALRYALVLADGGTIDPHHLPALHRSPGLPQARARRQAEAEALASALAQAKGNLSEAARILGVARTTLYRMIARHGLRPAP